MPTQDPVRKKEQWNAWYQKHKGDPDYKKKIRDFDKIRRKELIKWFVDIKSELSCKQCGFSHPAALDFHHLNPEEKLYEVSVMPGKSISKTKILAEMAKCEVYCSNCHRILHWEKRNK